MRLLEKPWAVPCSQLPWPWSRNSLGPGESPPAQGLLRAPAKEPSDPPGCIWHFVLTQKWERGELLVLGVMCDVTPRERLQPGQFLGCRTLHIPQGCCTITLQDPFFSCPKMVAGFYLSELLCSRLLSAEKFLPSWQQSSPGWWRWFL